MTRREADTWLCDEAQFERMSPDEWFRYADTHLLIVTYSKSWKGEHWTLSVYDGSNLVRRFHGDDPRALWAEYVFQ